MIQGDLSRIDRALSILRVDLDSTAEALADALWLANLLPREQQPDMAGKDIVADQDKAAIPPQPLPEQPPPAPAPALAPPGLSKVFPPQPRPSDIGDSLPATLITVPAADALPDRLAIERALKPFLRRFPSRRLKRLDGEKTAQASADRRRITPVFGPLPERWFDVLLLTERTDAMEVWSDTVRELHVLLGRHGAFRNVRILRFTVKAGAIELFTPAGQAFPARAAADPDGRRLCLFLTNGTSREWRRQPLIDFVRTLGRRTVVAIVQMLPQRLWGQTALGDCLERLHSLVPGAANAALQREDPFSGNSARTEDASCVPALMLVPENVARWAQFVMSPRRVFSPAIQMQPEAPGTARPARQRTPAQRLAAFRSTASPESFQLLRVLAGAPLTLPVIRLVQQAVSAGQGTVGEQFHLAEIMLSGLIERLTPADSGISPDQVSYDFVPEVRELLLQTLSTRESQAVDDALRPTQERLRRLVEAEMGRAIRDFRALLEDPNGLETLPASAKWFVEVNRRIYELRGIIRPGTGSKGPGESVAIQPRVLVGDAPVRQAVVSGEGRYIASVHGTAKQTWVQIWEQATGERAGDVALYPGEFQQLAAPADSDEMFVVTAESLISIASGTRGRLKTPESLSGKLCAISANGKWGCSAGQGKILCWDIETGRPLEVSSPPGFLPTALAMGFQTIFVSTYTALFGFRGGESGTVTVSPDPLCPLPGAAKSIVVSGDESAILVQTESGGALLVRSGSAATLRESEVTSIAMTQDGIFAALGGWDGRVSIWDLTRLVSIAELRQGTAEVESMSLSASGDYAASASRDGLKSWDLRELMRVARPQALRKARVPRNVMVYGMQELPVLTQRVIDSLRYAGHTASADQPRLASFRADYTVRVTVSSLVNPYLRDALIVKSEADLPRLLDELDRDPPGEVMNQPPVLQNSVARPELEEQLTQFIAEMPGRECFINGGELSGAHVTLLKVVTSDRVRRAYSGGIAWNLRTDPRYRQGRSLFVCVDDVPLPALPNDCVVLRLARPDAIPTAPVFHIAWLSREDADNHLRAAGMPEELLEEAAKFHGSTPLLVSLAAGAFRYNVPLETVMVLTPAGHFSRTAPLVIAKLDLPARRDFVRFAVRFADDPVQGTPRATLDFAKDCGWLLMQGNIPLLIDRTRELIHQLYPAEVAEAHEDLCAQIEQLTQTAENFYLFSGHGIDHAVQAGGVARVERFLRNPRILYTCLQRMPGELRSRIQPLAKGNAFLTRILEEASAQGSWASAPVERIYPLLAPPRQWPERSGVPGALATQIRGERIRIAVPGTGCNQEHPEFLGRHFPSTGAPDPSGYGTGVSSVLAGSYIGVAPGVLLEPITILGNDLTYSVPALSDALAQCLENPPDIICLTLTAPRTDDALYSVIQSLLKRDVLVIASAGNDNFASPEPGIIYPGVVSVGSCDFEDKLPARLPNSQRADLYGYGIDVTLAEGKYAYGSGSGTAYACAYAAGIAALYAQSMGIRGEELRKLLINTADPTTKIARFAVSTVGAVS